MTRESPWTVCLVLIVQSFLLLNRNEPTHHPEKIICFNATIKILYYQSIKIILNVIFKVITTKINAYYTLQFIIKKQYTSFFTHCHWIFIKFRYFFGVTINVKYQPLPITNLNLTWTPGLRNKFKLSSTYNNEKLIITKWMLNDSFVKMIFYLKGKSFQ